MKERTQKQHKALPREVRKGLLTKAGWIAVGFLMPQASLYGILSPFGVGAAVAVPDSALMAVAVSVLIGYWVAGGIACLRYMAAVSVIAGLRWALRGTVRGKRSRAVFAALGFVCVVATGLLLKTADVWHILADGAVAACFSLLFGQCAAVTRQLAGGRTATSAGQAALLTVVAVLVTACSRFSVARITPGHVVGCALILLMARCGKAQGGALCGALCGVCLALCDPTKLPLAAGYALAGMLSGFFSRFGRLAAAAVFSPALLVVLLGVTDLHTAAVWLYEAAAASLLFAVMPRKWERAVNAVVSRDRDGVTAIGVRDSLTDRLDMAADALYNVGRTVDEVSKRLAASGAPDMGSACRDLADTVCAGCPLTRWCWQEQYDATIETFQRQLPHLRAGEGVTAASLDGFIGQKCPRREAIAAGIVSAYRAQVARESAWRRLAEIREAAAGQFGHTGDLLHGFSRDLQAGGRVEADASSRVRIACEEHGLTVRGAVCYEQPSGRMTVEIRLYDDGGYFEERRWLRDIEEATGRRFAHPVSRRNGQEVCLLLCELPPFVCHVGMAQQAAHGERLCGDACSQFADGRGRQFVLLCDGMGTGSRAAVDGAMAAGLTAGMLHAGFDADSALRLTNTALMVREGQESLSTVDVLSVDVYTGVMHSFKAGAAASFLCSGGLVSRIERPSLPVGILREVAFEKTDDRLVPGDVVLMVSDGVLTGGEAWVELFLRDFDKTRGMQALCDCLVAEAVKRQDPAHSDDVTVCALQLTAAE